MEIKKFAEQSGLQAYYDGQEVAIKKFAELIINECQKSANQYIGDCGEVSSLPDTVFIKHFGVE